MQSIQDTVNNISSSVSYSFQQIWTRIQSVAADDASETTLTDSIPMEVWLLGQCYLGRVATFKTDFEHLVWMTYRSGFTPLLNDYSSDVGWGCMIRSGQMILANCLMLHSLGRDWRLQDTAQPHVWNTYVTVMKWFLDVESCPFSIHRITLFGQQELNVNIGSWFGPTSISQTIKYVSNVCG